MTQTQRSQHFFEMKRQAKPIVMLTAYDAPTAQAEVQAGVDILLVGDSVGTNVLGYASEKDVTNADICHHTRAVRRGAALGFVISDLPYKTYETPETAIANARQLVEAGADMVKFEGARPDILKALIGAGIEVCCHLGLEPQHHEEKRLKGRSAAEATTLREQAALLDEAGMSMLVLELMPEEVAGLIARSIKAPVIGIGAGRQVDGQVLVVTDVFGTTPNNFKHNKRYAEWVIMQGDALKTYVEEVRNRAFPGEANAFHMKEEELSILTAVAS